MQRRGESREEKKSLAPAGNESPVPRLSCPQSIAILGLQFRHELKLGSSKLGVLLKILVVPAVPNFFK
jgi:hypothetical protein